MMNVRLVGYHEYRTREDVGDLEAYTFNFPNKWCVRVINKECYFHVATITPDGHDNWFDCRTHLLLQQTLEEVYRMEETK